MRRHHILYEHICIENAENPLLNREYMKILHFMNWTFLRNTYCHIIKVIITARL